MRSPQLLNATLAFSQISQAWDTDLLAQLSHYITLPAKSPLFDPDWLAHGYLDAVVRNAADWVQAQAIAGLTLEILRLPGRTPLLFFQVAASRANLSTQTTLIYGHLDKQPEVTGWRADLGPWSPKYENGKLYGRGAADDGYAVYAAITAIKAIQAQQVDHARIVGIIETCEESGSYDLPAYLALLHARLGDVGLVICLDSGAGNYDQLWLTNSLRGMLSGVLTVEVLSEGVHSGDASGLVPSSFRVLRHLLDRLEDSASGALLPKQLHCAIPAERLAQAQTTAKLLGSELYARFPWIQYAGAAGAQSVLPTSTDPLQALLSRTWQPTLSVTGVAGLADLQNAGNVLRPSTALKLSLRLPPLVDAQQALVLLKALLEENPPYQAKVSFAHGAGAGGWNAPETANWLAQALQRAANNFFGTDCGYIGQGGTIPLINLLAERFAQAQMMICGVLGPNSNAHGPNEFLHIPYAKKLCAAVAEVIAAAASQ